MTTRTAVAASPGGEHERLLGLAVDLAFVPEHANEQTARTWAAEHAERIDAWANNPNLDARAVQIRTVEAQFMFDPERCDAPHCGELLVPEQRAKRSRSNKPLTCNDACRIRLNRWIRTQRRTHG